MKRNSKNLYEQIIRNISKEVKKALNEEKPYESNFTFNDVLYNKTSPYYIRKPKYQSTWLYWRMPDIVKELSLPRTRNAYKFKQILVDNFLVWDGQFKSDEYECDDVYLAVTPADKALYYSRTASCIGDLIIKYDGFVSLKPRILCELERGRKFFRDSEKNEIINDIIYNYPGINKFPIIFDKTNLYKKDKEICYLYANECEKFIDYLNNSFMNDIF